MSSGTTIIFVYIDAVDGAKPFFPIYQLPLFQWVRQEFPQALHFDLDNQSDRIVVEHACTLVENQPSYVMCFVKSEVTISTLFPFFRKLEQSKKVREAVMLGDLPLLEKMLSIPKNFSFIKFESEHSLKAHTKSWKEII